MVDANELIKDLQDMRDEGHLSDALMRRAVRTIAASDERFDWVGVYMFDEAENDVWLHNYVGSPTDYARIPVGEGVCGVAVAEKVNQNVPDVTEFPNYIECSPGTRSELVVLIRAGDDIYGEIDIDSNEQAAFSSEDVDAIQAVADKLAEQIAAERR
jgi:L-methionine (R)-S-oxide reductase